MEAPNQPICKDVIIIILRYTKKRNEVVAKKAIEKDDTNLAKYKRVCKQKKCLQNKTFTIKFIALGDGSFWVVERILNLNL